VPDAPTIQALPDAVRRFLADHRYGIVATVNPDGSPQQAVVWYLLVDDVIVVNSAEGRRWPSNLRRDRRMSFAVQDGLDWVGLKGEVEIVDDRAQAQADIAAMARLNDPPEVAERTIRNQFERQQRVSFRLRPTAIHAEISGG
jgi:PPOX class probable F420-dependent enzyme